MTEENAKKAFQMKPIEKNIFCFYNNWQYDFLCFKEIFNTASLHDTNSIYCQ